ncbi:DUF1453 domain-containing protein [Methanocella sp. MCL-LM]|uniref:DUF1453 domain-containing protein n=1 Tax=Methanocella sp. MCL-LM TaxID=3412035 RepID=UPI003C747476
MDYNIQGGDVFIGSSIFLVFIVIILLLQLRERRVRPLSMILMPALLLLVTAPVLTPEPGAGPIAWLLILIGFAAGVAAGLLIASRMHLKIDADGSMKMRGSVLAAGIWAAILLVKVYGKDLMAGTGVIDMNLLTSAFLALTLGMLIARRGYVFYRLMQLQKQNEQK